MIDFKIYETTNYSMFKCMEGNRAVKDGRVSKIVESINKVGYVLSPILVNEKMEVIDGQGRLSALERLKLPVHYMIQNGIGIDECIQMNIHQSNWSLNDYVTSYAIRGNDDYKRLQSLIDRFTELPIGTIIMCANNANYTHSGALSKKLKSGKMEISEQNFERARWELDYATKMKQVAKTIGGKKEPFYGAVVYAYRSLDSDGRNRMEDVIRKHAYDFPSLTKPVEYLKRFDGFYNDTVSKSKRIKLAVQWEVDTM